MRKKWSGRNHSGQTTADVAAKSLSDDVSCARIAYDLIDTISTFL